MFTIICSVLAAILAVSASKQYRLIALIVALEFAMHVLIYRYFFLNFRADNKWAIYLLYTSMQLPLMYWLMRAKAHFIIVLLIFINICYNLLTMAGYFNPNFIIFYEAKKPIIDVIMLLELTYLGILNKYVILNRTTNRKSGTSGFIDLDTLFRVCYRYINRGVV